MTSNAVAVASGLAVGVGFVILFAIMYFLHTEGAVNMVHDPFRVKGSGDFDLPSKAFGQAWFAIHPVQCKLYPWIDSRYDWTLEGQMQAIKTYFAGKGIQIMDVIYDPDSFGFPCEACSCTAGYTMYFLVAKEDVNKMEADIRNNVR